MASSPETIPLPGNTPVCSTPPSSPGPPLQDDPPPTTADPLEPAQSDDAVANPTPLPPPGQATATPPLAHESPARSPLDETTGGAAPPPPLFPREVASSALSELEAAESEEPTSPSPRPPVKVVEVSRVAEAVAASPPHSPQVAATSAVDVPPPSPSLSPTTSLSGALPNESSTVSVVMALEEAARPPQALESMHAGPRTAPVPPTESLDVGPEEQHPRPPSPAEHPGCEKTEPAQLPPPSPPPAETTHTLSGAAEAVAMTAEEAVVSPPPALEATGEETDTTPGIPPAFESDAEGSFQEPPSAPIEAEPSSPEMAPPGFGDFKSLWVPLSLHIQSIETTGSLLHAAAATDVAVPEEAAGSLHVLDAMNVKTDTAPDLPPPSWKSGAEQPLHQTLLRPSSPITQDMPCSPETPPPGFENFKSSWLPPTDPPLADTTYTSSDVVATKPVTVTPKGSAWPVPALHAMDMEADTTRSLLPPSESRVEGLLEQPLLRPLTQNQMVQSAPRSPDMAPPGFENFKSSWAPLSTPLSGTTGTGYVLHDAAGIEPVLEAMHATNSLLLPVESGAEGSLQEPQPRPPSPTMQDAPCSPDMAPPGFENFKSSQVLLPYSSLVQTAYTLHNPPASEAVNASEKAAQPSPALEAVYVNMDTTPSVQPSSGSGLEGSMPQQLQRLPSPKEKGTACSPEIVPSGHQNLQSLQVLKPDLPQLRTPDASADLVATKVVEVALEEVHHPPCILGAKEEGTVLQLEPFAPSLTAQAVDAPPDTPAKNSAAVKAEETAHPPPASQATDKNMDYATTSPLLSENGAEESLPQLQHRLSSPTAQAASCSPDSLQMLPPPPPPFLNQEMGQMVCGGCRELLAYPRGAVHVQCPSCRTINLVLEAHEVGNVHCGQCESLLMYPAGAPAVKCSLCLFVTEIGERNVRPRISVQQAVVPPHPPELTNQG